MASSIVRINPATCPEPGAGKTAAATTDFTDASGRLTCGTWRSQPGRIAVNYRRNEFCLLLEGEVHLTDSTGHTEVFRAGDAFVVPAGFVGEWAMPTPVLKHYVLHDPG
jgi:uncharacterized cupin superfamily protein